MQGDPESSGARQRGPMSETTGGGGQKHLPLGAGLSETDSRWLMGGGTEKVKHKTFQLSTRQVDQ